MAANKYGNAPVKPSVKRMHRSHRMEAIERGRTKLVFFLHRFYTNYLTKCQRNKS